MAEKRATELSRDLRALVTKGNEAASRDNFDYAIALYSQVLQKEPSCFEVRRKLRAVQINKTGGRTSFFKKVLSSAGSSPLLAKAQIALRKDPGEALHLAEQMLNSDPFNSAAHKVIVEAANALKLQQTALFSLDLLAKNSPKDKSIISQYAHALADAGQIARAEELLNGLVNQYPQDGELATALKNLSARRTMDEGGYDSLADGEGSYRDILKDEHEAVQLEQEAKVVKSEDAGERLIAEYEQRLKTEPENTKMIRSLAELYAEKKRFDEALELYARIQALAQGSDPSLDRAISETKVKQLESKKDQLDPTAPDYADQVAAIEAEKLQFQVEECRKRVEKFPTDLSIRFEMGTLLFKAGKISEAIKEFQKAQGNPHRKLAAMGYLAQCFAKRKMYDLAARTLQNAIKEKEAFDGEKKDLIYNLGCVLESMDKKEEAIEQFKLIYEVDIGYRDVAEKVDAYYAEQ